MQFVRRGTRAERMGYGVGALLLVSGLVHAAILIASNATWEGPLSLRKPMTFGLSFGLTLISIVWASAFVQLPRRTRSLVLSALTGACLLETSLVSLQAWRGVPSHFNIETPFDATVARTLAAGGFTLIIVIAILTYASVRTGPPVPMSLRIATRTGFIVLLGAQIVGGTMIARGMTLVFGGDAKAAYLMAGALKPMHAVMMHGVLMLPALAWLLSFANWSERRRTTIVLVAVAGYAIFVAAVAVMNLASLATANVNNGVVPSGSFGSVCFELVSGGAPVVRRDRNEENRRTNYEKDHCHYPSHGGRRHAGARRHRGGSE